MKRSSLKFVWQLAWYGVYENTSRRIQRSKDTPLFRGMMTGLSIWFSVHVQKQLSPRGCCVTYWVEQDIFDLPKTTLPEFYWKTSMFSSKRIASGASLPVVGGVGHLWRSCRKWLCSVDAWRGCARLLLASFAIDARSSLTLLSAWGGWSCHPNHSIKCQTITMSFLSLTRATIELTLSHKFVLQRRAQWLPGCP